MTASSLKLQVDPADFRPTQATIVDPKYNVHDSMRYGLAENNSTNVLSTHPVELIQKHSDALETQRKHELLRLSYGEYLPLCLETERKIVSQTRRFPCLPSSNIGLDILSGKDETIDFEDWLNPVEFRESEIDVLSSMEYEMKWSFNDIH